MLKLGAGWIVMVSGARRMVMPKLSPIESEFATTEDAEAYDLWFRAKVRAALDDDRASVTHDAAMARIRSVIEAARKRQKSA